MTGIGINTAVSTNMDLKNVSEPYITAGYQPTEAPVTPGVQLQNNPQTPAPNMVQDGQNMLEKTPKSDTITIAGKTIKKKTAIKAGLGALATAAVIGIGVFTFRGRGKTPPAPVIPPVQPPVPAPVPESAPLDPAKLADELQTSANEMLQRANETIETAQKKVETATELFNNGGKDASGKVVAQIEDIVETKSHLYPAKIMREFAEDGTTIIRESEFDKDVCHIAEFLADGTRSASITAMYNDGSMLVRTPTRKLTHHPNIGKGSIEYTEGLVETKNIKAPTRILSFIDGQLAEYKENTVVDKKGSLIQKIIRFMQGTPSKITTKETKFDDEVSTETVKFFEKLENGTWKIRE